MSSRWLLYDFTTDDGAMHMALDEAIMEQFQGEPRGQYAGAIRFYGFNTPTVTTGYFQPYEEVVSRVGADVAVVRRMTAGGVVEHDGSLTMTMVTYPDAHPFFQNLEECYKMLHVTICKALRRCDVACVMQAHETTSGRAREMLQCCFVDPVKYDLLSGGEKIVGGAQKRSRGVILHQGSIQLTRPEFRARERLGELVRVMIAKTFEEDFDVCFERVAMNSALTTRADELMREKYAHESWRMKF